MSDLFVPIPGFDQPIAVLKHCHDRIRKQISTLQKLALHLPQHGADSEAQRAAIAILQYFNKAAPKHHEDEEHDLLPMLQTTASGDDASLLQQLMPQIMEEHQQMDALWRTLAPQLRDIAAASANTLSADTVAHFAELYAAHMQKEETHIAPMAKRLFSAAQMTQLGDAMQARRAVD